MNLAGVIFVASFLACVYFARETWRAFCSPEFKRDLEELREQRRANQRLREHRRAARKAAR